MIYDPELCRKFTDLTEDEIQYLGTFESRLQELADTEEADVFIDCCSSSGKSAIVVAEAKPHTVPSAYEMIILGMIIRWENEPAVERTFRVGLPTTGMMSVSSPENQRVVQSVYPIVYKDRIIATLIYEKAILVGKKKALSENIESSFRCCSTILDNLFDAILITNSDGVVISYNRRAGELLEELGYVDDVNGMKIENLWDSNYIVQSASGTEIIRVSDHILEGKMITLGDGIMDRMYAVKDVTELINWQKEYKKSVMARRELKHRIKNSLELLYSIFEKKRSNTGNNEAGKAYEEAVIRIASVLVTLDDMGSEEDGLMSLKEAIELLCQDISYTYNCRNIRITGDDISIEGKKVSVLCMIVSELIYNALKYAWNENETGHIHVELIKDVLNNTLAVEDDGHGINNEKIRKGSIGLDLVKTLASERLQGDIRVITGTSGTRVEVDFI